MDRMISVIGLLSCLATAYAFSSNRKAINWKTVLSGIFLQLAFALIILKTTPGQEFFEGARSIFTNFLNFSEEGAKFMFGSLADTSKVGFVFLTMVLPTIIFLALL